MEPLNEIYKFDIYPEIAYVSGFSAEISGRWIDYEIFGSECYAEFSEEE
jgi:hypothetical protein